MSQPLLYQSLDQLANASTDNLHANLLKEFYFLILTDLALTLTLMLPMLPSLVILIIIVLCGQPFAAVLVLLKLIRGAHLCLHHPCGPSAVKV